MQLAGMRAYCANFRNYVCVSVRKRACNAKTRRRENALLEFAIMSSKSFSSGAAVRTLEHCVCVRADGACASRCQVNHNLFVTQREAREIRR
jgi:hypothetical protein